jgi:hypothetical protein
MTGPDGRRGHIAAGVRLEVLPGQIGLPGLDVQVGINFLRMNKIGIQSVNTCHRCSKLVHGWRS